MYNIDCWNTCFFLKNAYINFPDKIAIADSEKEITYSDLYYESIRIAKYIKLLGIHNAPVVVWIDRNIVDIELFWGILFSGNFYVPLSNDMPEDRKKLILEQICSELVFDKTHKFEKPWKIETIDDDLEDIIDNILDVDPAYMVMTSGTTGIPKGVVKSHRSIIEFVKSFLRTFNLDNKDVFGNQVSFDFDVAAKDIFISCYLGATLQIIPHKCFLSSKSLASFLINRKITVLIWSVAAVRLVAQLKCFSSTIPNLIRYVFFSGEVIPQKVIDYWKSTVSDAIYVNLYAPTEVTGNCLYKIVDESSSDGRIALGKTFSNIAVFLQDEEGNLIDGDGRGELCIKGAFLSLGYFRDEERTKQSLVQNKFNQSYPDMIYMTGDVVERKNNELYFLSRKDDQIKHMGHRIELGDIESVLYTLDYIKNSAAVYIKEDDSIILFVECNKEAISEIKDLLRNKLPKYMIPQKVISVEYLPLTQRGKIDRIAIKEAYINEYKR